MTADTQRRGTEQVVLAPESMDTFPKLLAHHAQVRGNRPAMREKNLGIWQSWTWKEVADEVAALAGGLAAMGFKRGDKLAIIGDNRPRLYWGFTAGPESRRCAGASLSGCRGRGDGLRTG